MNKEKWIARALEKGIEGFEIYQTVSSSKEVTWFDHQMDTYVTSKVTGTSIRGIVDGKVSYIALETVDDETMDETIDQLMKQAKTISAEEKSVLVGPKELGNAKNPRVWVSPSTDQIYKVMEEIEDKVSSYDPRVLQMASLGWSEGSSSREITNSLGLQVEDEQDTQYISCSVAVGQDGEVKDSYLVKLVENLDGFDVDGFVKELVDEALNKLGGTSISSRTCPVIIEKSAMSSLFTAFSAMFSGELIHKGISPLKGKLGDKIFSDLITVIDDPQNTDALSTINFDDEGYPTRKKVIVDKGVFEQMLHSTKSALEMNAESTGNGFKAGYSSSVGVQPFNMYIAPGKKSLDELKADMKEGLVIEELMGLHAGINFVSTNFSLQAAGYWVKDGKREKPVTLITVASSFMELMNQVVSVGSDLDWKYYSVVAPSIYFEKCAVSGD